MTVMTLILLQEKHFCTILIEFNFNYTPLNPLAYITYACTYIFLIEYDINLLFFISCEFN